MDYIEELIEVALIVAVLMLLILSKYISDGFYDFFDSCTGIIIYERCKKKGELHQPNNKWYVWWASHRLMDGNEDISWLTYEKHFVNGNFYYK